MTGQSLLQWVFPGDGYAKQVMQSLQMPTEIAEHLAGLAAQETSRFLEVGETILYNDEKRGTDGSWQRVGQGGKEALSVVQGQEKGMFRRKSST
jgi:hypothetical protein